MHKRFRTWRLIDKSGVPCCSWCGIDLPGGVRWVKFADDAMLEEDGFYMVDWGRDVNGFLMKMNEDINTASYHLPVGIYVAFCTKEHNDKVYEYLVERRLEE